MARGKDDFADAFVDEKIGISEYPLSASVACGKVRFFFLLDYPLSCYTNPYIILVLLRTGRTLGHYLITIALSDSPPPLPLFRYLSITLHCLSCFP